MNPKEEVERQSVFKEENDTNENSAQTQRKTSMGMDENIAGLLCYLAGFITGIIFILMEKESRFVRYHAIQSIIVSAALIILNIVLTAIPFIGWAIGIILAPICLVLWIYMMVKAYKGQWLKLPIAGEMAEKQLNKLNGK